MEHPLVDVLVRVLVADGLSARRTGPDRLEVGKPAGGKMEWCCYDNLIFGRSTTDVGERAWVYRLPAGPTVAPFDLGRDLSRTIRGAA